MSNADNTVSNNSIVRVAFRIRDDWQVRDHSEDWGDSTSRVRRLSPSSHSDKLFLISSVSTGRQAAGLNPIIEFNWTWELNESNIIGQCVVIPVGVGKSIVRGDLLSVRFTGCSNIVSSGHDVKVGSSINTVSSSQNIVLRDQGSSAEPSIIYKESYLPWPLVFCCFFSSNNLVHSRGSFNSAFSHQVIFGGLDNSLLGNEILGSPRECKNYKFNNVKKSDIYCTYLVILIICSSHVVWVVSLGYMACLHLDHMFLPCGLSGVLGVHGMSWLELGEVPWLWSTPVFLRAKSASIRDCLKGFFIKLLMHLVQMQIYIFQSYNSKFRLTRTAVAHRAAMKRTFIVRRFFRNMF